MAVVIDREAPTFPDINVQLAPPPDGLRQHLFADYVVGPATCEVHPFQGDEDPPTSSQFANPYPVPSPPVPSPLVYFHFDGVILSFALLRATALIAMECVFADIYTQGGEEREEKDVGSPVRLANIIAAAAGWVETRQRNGYERDGGRARGDDGKPG